MRLRGRFHEGDKENTAWAAKRPGQAKFSGGCSADIGGDFDGNEEMVLRLPI